MAKEKEKMKTTFRKEQLVNSKKYAEYRDVLNAILIDGQHYTVAQVDEELKTFLEGKVKK
ncbi:hypothetical protein [Cytobacillus massiliigabonensis]|uniref:hypothetical protein n=1 Tax=Cytobacillus massiliigabonensis TaxID=1871011 RepID=UPI000C83563D|nr:hypothetical protein [Cytobacillus massiliigabonensis]